MTTLPVLNTSTTVTSRTAASLKGDAATGDLASELTGEGSTADAKQAPAFLQLLGDRLLTLAKKQAGDGQAAVTGDAAVAIQQDAAAEKQAVSNDLNKLLSSLDKPEALGALLQPQATKSDDDNTPTTADKTTLSDSDMQALQALFAMLPHNMVQPVVTAQSKSDNQSSDLLSSGKSAASSSLNALLSSAAGKETDHSASSKGDVSSTVTAAVSNTHSATTTDSAKDATFQQVLSSVSKESDKENSSSTQNATITNTVVSAASATQTPTATTLVTAPATPQLNAQLGSQEWQQALGQQVLMFSRNGQHSAELHLHPEDLGSIQISLQLNNDQANLNMVSAHSQVRAALEAAIPHLRHALAESGINLGQSNVSSDAFAQGQASSGQQEQRNNHRGNTFSLSQDNESDAVPVAVPASLQGRVAGSGAVDIFA